MISSPDTVRQWLSEEWTETVRDASEQALQKKISPAMAGDTAPIEEIGNRLYRFHLTGGYDLSIAAPLLARLFFLTAKRHRGTLEGLRKKLTVLQEPDKQPALAPWLDEYIRDGYPALHHSEIYRQAYAPHYRILRDEYAIYFPIIYQIEKRLQRSDHVIVAIDGPCGSGKSSLAALLAELFSGRVLHMDDYYLPLQRRSPGWEHTPCGNMDLDRLMQEVLLPAARGETISCRPYSCRQGQLLEARILPGAPLTIVEGSYSHHPMLASHHDLKIFLHCRHQEQLARLKHREGTQINAYLQRWIPLEEAYHRAFDIVAQCDLYFDNTPYFM